MHQRLGFLYDCDCEDCATAPEQIDLAAKKGFKQLLNDAEKAFKKLHESGRYRSDDLFRTKEYKNLINATSGIFNSTIHDNKIPDEMRQSLREDIFVFSALKTHAQLSEASRSLMTDDGKVKSFAAFSKDIEKLNSSYNQQYLEAEYQFAVTSAQMAAKWAQVSDDYLLQYRTASDDRVRKSHADLHNTTLPKEDPFWLSYYPPNGWRCRCNAVQVRKEKYEVSNSATALKNGEAATSQIGKDGKNKLEIFRFNPGLQKVVFPPTHPYHKVAGAKKVIQTAGTHTIIQDELRSTEDVSAAIGVFASRYPEYFAHGYKFTTEGKRKGLNGYTTMRGDIYLSGPRMSLMREALNNIRNGKPTSLAHEDALSTFHHEMWHNANKPGNMRLTASQTLYMEMANEYVSRKTLPDFMNKLGGQLQNKKLVDDRQSTAYNSMVRKYDKLVEWSKADKQKVVESLKSSLINERYDKQLVGLIKAILTNTDFKLSPRTIQTLLQYAKDDRVREDSFEDLLNRNNNLLVKKSK